MKKLVSLFISLLSISMVSCGDFKDVSFSRIENVKITQMSQQGAEAEITALIKNPNNVSFTIYSSDLDVMLNGMNTGKAYLAGNIKINANAEKPYTFKIKSDFSKLSLNDLPKLFSIAMSKNIKVGLKGNLKVGKWFFTKSYPVDLSQNVPLSGK